MISICIPSVEKRTTRRQIFQTFTKIKWGEINTITMKTKKENTSAFIYFKKWNIDLPNVKQIHEKILKGEEINLVYDFPWFWKCRANIDIRFLKQEMLKKKVTEQQKLIQRLNAKFLNLQSYTRWLQKKN